MRALVKRKVGPGHLELMDVAVPKIGSDDVLLKVTFCGICGSDLHMETGLHRCDPPVILGHEYTGVVAEVGKNVTQFAVGDAASYRWAPNPFPGVTADGGFAEYIRLPANTLFPTPAGVSPQAATQFETAIVPIRLVRDIVGLKEGERVVITGPGPIGALCANLARLHGASHITVLGGPGDEKMRLAKALEMGADVTVPFSDHALSALQGEKAPQVWLETSGAPAAIAAAVEHVARHGRISVSGLGVGPWNINMHRVAYDSLRVIGQWGGDEAAIPECGEMIADGRLLVDTMISAVMPLTEWQQAFAILRAKEALKILLDPSA